MIFRIFCISIIFAGAGAFAKTKIALIGDSEQTNQVADMVLAKLANNDKLEFLERSAIEQVLKEHKLQGSGLNSKQIPLIANVLHADVFAVLSSAQVKNKTVPSSLRIFDARNGFCLLDTALPAKAEKCADFVNAKLKSAVKILSDPKSLKFVSILAVRNAGAPEKYKRQMANTAMEVERRLIAMPDVAVLERSELGLVNKERKITGKSFKLAPSAYLLDFEFSPASSADKVDLKVYVLNVSGKELTSFKFPDCLKTPPQQIIKVLAKYLKTSPPLQLSDNKEEARRFWAEYKYAARAGKYDTAEYKLETVIALVPDSPVYRHEMAKYVVLKAKNWPRNLSRDKRYMEVVAAAERAMKICDEIKVLFPNYDPGRMWQLYSINLFGDLANLNSYNSLNYIQQAMTNKFLKEYRARSFREFRRYCRFDLSDGINSLQELKNYNNYMHFTCFPICYPDFKEFVSVSYATALEQLKCTKKAMLANPALMKDKRQNNLCKPTFFVLTVSAPCLEFSGVIEDRIKNSQELIELAKSHPARPVQEYGYLLDLYRKLLINNYDQNKFARDLRIYFAKGFKFPLARFRSKLSSNLCDIVRREETAFKSKHGELSKEEAVINSLRSAKDTTVLARIIIENADLVKKMLPRCNTDNNFKNTFYRIARRLNKGNAEDCRKALNILNYPLLCKQLKILDNLIAFRKGRSGIKLTNIKEFNDKIYLLLHSVIIADMYITILCFDPVKNKLFQVKCIPESVRKSG